MILYTGFTSLLISIYSPADSGPSSYTEYLNTLGELEGFNHCDNGFVVGDFNVDFDPSSSRSKLLCEFMSNLGLISCDLSFRDEVKFILMSMMTVSVVLGSIIFYALSLLVL